MNQGSNKILPTIDDRYWFEFSRSLLDSAITRRENAADALQKLVIWLWGIYTASAAVGFALSGKQLELWPTLAIALPSGLLVLVYWGTIWVQMPKVVAFDPRSPTEIEQAFSEILTSKSRRLAFTLFLSVVAAIMVSIGLVVASVSKSPQPALSDFYAVLGEDQNGSIVSVTANAGKTSITELSVTPVSKDNSEQSESIVMRLVPTDEGLIQTSMRLNVKVEAVRVQLTWEDETGLVVQLSKVVKGSNFGVN